MSWIMLAIICILLVGSAYRCLRRVLLEEVRQDLYRIRERIYDRVIARELTLQDPSVAGLVQYLHGFVWFLEHWSPLLYFWAMIVARGREENVAVPWLDDERLKKEAWLALQATVAALRRAWLPLRLQIRFRELPAPWMEKTPRALIEEMQNKREREAGQVGAREAYEATTRMVSRVKTQGAVPAIVA